MVNKKNLRNLGFTIFEALAVIAIMGVIASMSIPVILLNQKRYNQLIFEQNCKMYEAVFLDAYDLYQYEHVGTTSLTNNVTLRIPFTTKIETQVDKFVDILKPNFVFYFLYETLVKSNFAYKNYYYEYTPAEITKTFTYYPSVFTLTLDDVVIVCDMEIMSSLVGGNQLAYIRQVTINQNDLSYSFEV